MLERIDRLKEHAMIGGRIDAAARAWAAGTTRRTAIAGALAAMVGGAALAADAGAATCRPKGSGCTAGTQCCTGYCSPGGSSARTRRRTCQPCDCPNGTGCGQDKVCRDCTCVFEGNFGFSPSVTYQALTSPEGVAALGFEHDAVPVVGSTFTFRTDPRGRFSGVIEGKVLALEQDEAVELELRLVEMTEPAIVRLTLLTDENGAARIEMTRLTGSREACAMAAGLLGDDWANRLFNQRLTAYIRDTGMRA
jgi:hypothetical protein